MFEPITRWVLRCDGDTTHGQCPTRLLYTCTSDEPAESWYPGPDELHGDDDRDGDVCEDGRTGPAILWAPAIYDRPDLDIGVRAELRAARWLSLRDGRVLCPDHVAAADYLVRAAIDGLPFPDTYPDTHADAVPDALPGRGIDGVAGPAEERS